MRILVTGSRDWNRKDIVYRSLKKAIYNLSLKNEQDYTICIVHGGCKTGADKYAADFVHDYASLLEGYLVFEEVHDAEWSKYGRSAGPRRNQEMVDAGADVCLAFIRNNSNCASGTVKFAEAAGIPTVIERINEEKASSKN